jgi:membrane AbrB-like protein
MVRRAALSESDAKIAMASAVEGLEASSSYSLESESTAKSLAMEKRIESSSSVGGSDGFRIACLLPIGIGSVGALLLTAVGLPGGAVVGAILAVGAAGVIMDRVELPPARVRDLAMLGMGIAMGESVTPQTGPLLLASLPVVVLMTLGTLGSSLVLARFVQRQLRVDACTAILACAPGGLSQMPLVAAEVGANMGSVTVFQLTRFLSSIVVLPVLFRLLLM